LYSFDVEEHFKAVINSSIGAAYKDMGQVDSAIVYFAKAAIHDIVSATKETTALYHLAEIMLEQEEYKEADRYIDIALVDAKGNLNQALGGGRIVDLPPFRGYSALEQHCTIADPIEMGDRIRVYYRSEKTPVWTCITGGEECVWELLVSDAKTIDESTVIRYDKLAKKLTVTVKSGVDVSFESSAGTAMDDRMEVSGNDVTIQAEGLPLDTYVLKLKKGAEYKEVKIKLGTAQ
jgi:tetratricopeptide (TPR) repeat protein